eukprot:TRINITY_DN4239_c0_g1_i1.p1 TRINITY_DN4239_c0_g1~~TRINITY_DN4239_c0_g1_i1.p1  ORF type:complete len:177 (-),score=36.12 TRINITY_DN4239_c0_g1_i1:162-692(-)
MEEKSFMDELTEAHNVVMAAFAQTWKDGGLPTWGEALKMNAEFLEHCKLFIAAVNWTEPLLLGIGAFHVLMLLLVIVTRKNFNLQVGLVFILSSIVLSATFLNDLGMKHWKSVATQAYFSPNGLFISAVLSFPLVLISILAIFNIVRSLIHSMAMVKRAQFRREAAQKAAAAKKSN